MLGDIRRGAPPPRGKDRGLTVNHLETFLNPTVWKTFEGDGENVLCLFFLFFDWSTWMTCHRASSPSIKIFSLDWRTMSRSGLRFPKTASLVSETTNPHGPNPKAAPKSVYSTQGGLTSPHRKISLGSINGIFQMLQTAGQEGSYRNTCPCIFSDLVDCRLMEKENRKAREDARKEYNDTVKAGYPPQQSIATL